MPQSASSHCSKLAFDHAHESIEKKPDQANSEYREEDVGVDETVVLLPQKAADSRGPSKHLGGHDDQPGNAQRQPAACKDIGERGRDDHFPEHLRAWKLEHAADVQIILWDTAHSHGRVNYRWPHSANGDCKESRWF